MNFMIMNEKYEFVATAVDITPSHMSNIETGKTKVSLSTFFDKIPNHFNYFLAFLIIIYFCFLKYWKYIRSILLLH